MAETGRRRRHAPLHLVQGQLLDNAVMENFFRHLKDEMFHHDEHKSVEAFTTKLGDYIHWYN